MTTFISHVRLRCAVRTLREGGIIAYPTEGVWGLGCDPLNADAVCHLLALKQRPVEKGLILIAADMAQLEPYLKGLNTTQLGTLKQSWPGPHTWLVPANDHVPYWISGGQPTVALRISAHPVVQALCNAFSGAIVSTSANVSGKPAARSLLDVQLQFSALASERVTLVPGSLGNSNKPTTIQDLASGSIIRA